MSTASSPTTEPRAETGGGPGPSLYPREDPRTPAGGSAWPSGGQWRQHVPGDMSTRPTPIRPKTKVVVTKDLTLQSRSICLSTTHSGAVRIGGHHGFFGLLFHHYNISRRRIRDVKFKCKLDSSFLRGVFEDWA